MGGIHLGFTDGTNADSTTDENGQPLAADGNQSQTTWQLRTVNLASYAGKTVSTASLVAGPETPAGSWFLFIAKAAIVSTNGTVTQIYNQSPSAGLSFSGTSGVTNANSSVTTFFYIQKPVETTNYYISDQLGSTRMEIGAEGWPVSSDTYYPFGQELAASSSPNNYKFTGNERDAESGNDYFGARYYASSMGRFMSPDPSQLAYADQTNPQSLNLYSYGRNNPLVNTDPTGMDCVNDKGDGTFTTNTGDCDNSTEEKANAGHYIDCDGCTEKSTGGTLDPTTGTLSLTDASGNLILGTNVSDWSAPTGVSTTEWLSGKTNNIALTGYGIPGGLYIENPATIGPTPRTPPPPPPGAFECLVDPVDAMAIHQAAMQMWTKQQPRSSPSDESAMGRFGVGTKMQIGSSRQVRAFGNAEADSKFSAAGLLLDQFVSSVGCGLSK